MTTFVELTVEDKVAIVTLNRPEVRNAINDALRAELVALLERVAADEGMRAVVLTGKGKAFCAGGDITGMKERLKAPVGQVAFNGWRRQGQTHKSVRLAARYAESGYCRGEWRCRWARLRHGARLRLHSRLRAGRLHHELR